MGISDLIFLFHQNYHFNEINARKALFSVYRTSDKKADKRVKIKQKNKNEEQQKGN